MIYQYIEESTGLLYRQAVEWDEEYGWVGVGTPHPVSEVPRGAQRLDMQGLEWMPVDAAEDGATAVTAWFAGS